MKIARVHNVARLGIQLVEVVLGREDIDILFAGAAQCVHQRLGEDLFSTEIVVVAGQLCLKQLAELRAADNSRVHVVIVLVAGPGVVTTPSDGVCGGQAIDALKEAHQGDRPHQEAGMSHSEGGIGAAMCWMLEVFGNERRETRVADIYRTDLRAMHLLFTIGQ